MFRMHKIKTDFNQNAWNNIFKYAFSWIIVCSQILEVRLSNIISLLPVLLYSLILEMILQFYSQLIFELIYVKAGGASLVNDDIDRQAASGTGKKEINEQREREEELGHAQFHVNELGNQPKKTYKIAISQNVDESAGTS